MTCKWITFISAFEPTYRPHEDGDWQRKKVGLETDAAFLFLLENCTGYIVFLTKSASKTMQLALVDIPWMVVETGEFMPSPSATSTDPASLKCAACGCHRNFHCRDPYDGPAFIHRLPPNASSSPSSTPPSPMPYSFYTSAPHMLLALTPAYSSETLDEYQHHVNNSNPCAPMIKNSNNNPSGRNVE